MFFYELKVLGIKYWVMGNRLWVKKLSFLLKLAVVIDFEICY